MPRKVLLINPNLMKPVVTPVAIDYLAQTLEEKGFVPEVLDLAFAADPREELARSFRKGEYLLIAITLRNIDDSYFPSQDFCLQRTKTLIDQIRGLTEAPLVLGGVGFSIRPEEALTDKEQQITPDQLSVLLSGLVIRKEHGTIEFENKLEELRSEIDKLDEELIDILGRRMDIVEEIGKYKKENNITILQLKRWSRIIHDRVDTGVRIGLSREFLLKLLEALHEESIQRQTEVMNRDH